MASTAPSCFSRSSSAGSGAAVRSRAISRATRARPRGERSSWLMAPRSSRWPRTMASMRSAMRLKLTATSRTSDATHRRRPPARSVRTARSPPPKRSAACARASSGRASWLATPPAIDESTPMTSASPSANLHQAHGRTRGPKRSISRAPASLSSRTTGTKMCSTPSGAIAPPRAATRCTCPGSLCGSRTRRTSNPVTSRTSSTKARVATGSSQDAASRADTLRASASVPDAGSGRVVDTTRPLVAIVSRIAPKNQKKSRDRSERGR